MRTALQPVKTSAPGVPPWLELVAQQVNLTRFGVIQIVVHDRRVVQVEKTEKYRFEVRAGTAPTHLASDRNTGD